MDNTLSFVLTVTFKENISNEKWRKVVDSNTAIRFNMLIKSFLTNFDLIDLEIFLIICPKKDIINVNTLLRRQTNDNRFKILDENEVCSHLQPQNQNVAFSGWYIQQILKLIVAKYIKTDFYLTLDNDVIFKKQFNRSLLIPHGKAFVNVETISDYNELYRDSFSNREWTIKNNRLHLSSILINYRRKNRFKQKSYGETPVLMHRQSVLGLLEELTFLYYDWIRVLTRISGWTEYTLYFQYLEKHNLVDKLYTMAGRSTLLDLDSSVWFPPSVYKKNICFTPDYVFNQKIENGFFVVIQSYLDEKTWLPNGISDTKKFYSMLEKIIDVKR